MENSNSMENSMDDPGKFLKETFQGDPDVCPVCIRLKKDCVCEHCVVCGAQYEPYNPSVQKTCGREECRKHNRAELARLERARRAVLVGKRLHKSCPDCKCAERMLAGVTSGDATQDVTDAPD